MVPLKSTGDLRCFSPIAIAHAFLIMRNIGGHSTCNFLFSFLFKALFNLGLHRYMVLSRLLAFAAFKYELSASAVEGSVFRKA